MQSKEFVDNDRELNKLRIKQLEDYDEQVRKKRRRTELRKQKAELKKQTKVWKKLLNP